MAIWFCIPTSNMWSSCWSAATCSVGFGFWPLLKGILCYLILVLICNSLMTSDVEDYFICLLSIHISSFIIGLFGIFAQFWSRVFLFCYCWVLNFLIHFRYKSLMRYVFDKYFLLFYGLSFFLLLTISSSSVHCFPLFNFIDFCPSFYFFPSVGFRPKLLLFLQFPKVHT